jgi:hypothetical protein
MFAVYFFHYLVIAIVAFMVLGSLAMPVIYFANRQDQKIAAGDVKAAVNKAWFAAICAALGAGLVICDLAHHIGLWPQSRDWAFVIFCTYKSVELWQNVRRMRSGQKPSGPRENPL